jgi:hypothetical protein
MSSCVSKQYRSASVGIILVESLNEMLTEGIITKEIAENILVSNLILVFTHILCMII